MRVNNVDTDVKCMTVDDVEGLRQYLILIQEMFNPAGSQPVKEGK